MAHRLFEFLSERSKDHLAPDGNEEIVDVWLSDTDQALDPSIKELLQCSAPPGLVILSLENVDDSAPALQTRVASADYLVTLLEQVDRGELGKNIAELLQAASLPRQRRDKNYDLRPLVEALGLLPADATGSVRLTMRLAAREGATGRPEEVLDALGIPFENTRIERTHLVLKGD